MINEEQLKVQREFVNLLLNHQNVVDEWLHSNLLIEHFDASLHPVLRAIMFSIEKDVLLTRRSYISFLSGTYGQYSKQEIINQELIFIRIDRLNTKVDDYPMLRDKILDYYLTYTSMDLIRGYNKDHEKSGIRYAIANLSDELRTLSESAREGAKNVFEDINDVAPEYIKYLEDVRDGKIEEKEVVTCDIREIDYAMNVGFAPGTLTLFVADVGGYKSTMMLNVAMNIWKKGKNVLFVPLEMHRHLMFQRMISRELNIPFEKFTKPGSLTDEEMQRAKESAEEWKERPGKFYIMEGVEDRTRVSSIRLEIEKHIDIFKPDLVVVDYIANLDPDKERMNRNDLEIGDMLKSLRGMGKNLNFAIISGAQLGREALKRIRKQSGDKIIAYSEDVRGSHEYSADADFIFVLMPDPQQPSALIHLVVIKSRYGKKTFQDGRSKAALEVLPEIGMIKSREDMLLNVSPEDILSKAEGDDLEFDEDDIAKEDENTNTTLADDDDLFEDIG